MLQCIRDGKISGIDVSITENKVLLLKLLESIGNDSTLREEKVSFSIERLCVIILLYKFYTTGRLASQSELSICNDEEYIGSVLSFAQEISRYVLGRACEGDIDSIETCRQVVLQLNGKMLEFDFRNGPLRRKYDGLKYSLKTIEDISYELSLQDPSRAILIDATKKPSITEDENTEGPLSKKLRTFSLEGGDVIKNNNECQSSSLLTTEECLSPQYLAELDEIRLRMEHFDKSRELVIKDSRDVQKLSKLAVYSVIRGQLGDAKRKLHEAGRIANKILTTVSTHHALRGGSFSNSLEEWAEGLLLLEWVQSKHIMSKSQILSYNVENGFAFVLNNAEYIGALSDFTGEIGRLAVAQASKRNLEAVQEIHQADLVVSNFITLLNVTNQFGKKLEAVNTNLRKVEDIVFELSMLCRGSRAGKQMSIALDMPHSHTSQQVDQEEC